LYGCILIRNTNFIISSSTRRTEIPININFTEYKKSLPSEARITFSCSGCEIKAKLVPANKLIIQAEKEYKSKKTRTLKKLYL
jgi:hypothetical protein